MSILKIQANISIANTPATSSKNTVIAASLLVYIDSMSNTSVSSFTPEIHDQNAIAAVRMRRVRCSFLEPIPEIRRSASGKPYRPPRTKSPAPEDMVIRAKALKITGKSHMLLRSGSFSRCAMALFKRVSADAVCTNSKVDVNIGEAQRWQREMEEFQNL
jgi:hypothetical protein